MIVFFHTTIAVGENAVFQNMECRRYEHMVDSAFGVVVRVETVECAVSRITQVGYFECVAECSTFCLREVGAMSLVYIEISGEYSR